MPKSKKSNRRTTTGQSVRPGKMQIGSKQIGSKVESKSERSPPKKRHNGKNGKVDTSRIRFPVVGIGASAGGLEAIKELLQKLPLDTGMAFVFVQHLDPTHESLVQEILSRATQMPVHEIKDSMRVKPNNVYIIPPNFDLALLHDVLSLLPPQTGTRGQHLVIDSFFQSLAMDQKGRAIGVILSGTASDGTQGLKAIKSEGGLTIAQDPKSARYSGMPESAIASGFVDLILTPSQIAQELARVSKHPYVADACGLIGHGDGASDDDNGEGENKGDVEPGLNEVLRKIFVLLRARMQIDFSNYKSSTVMRRIQRRMMVQKSENIDAYARFLQDNPNEIKALYADILIHVTQFFRDPNSFKVLQDKVFPQLLKNRDIHAPIRIWVPGCSTGEEAYSIGILLLEFLSQAGTKVPIQIFATDISEQAIQKARNGFYPQDIEDVVSKERLKRFFEKVSGGYKVKKTVRDLCLFSRHDLTSDPPFSKIDLVSCRNVLIYFAAVLQKRVIPVLHYALRTGGFLFLGKSENLGGQEKLFTLVDKTYKLFSKANIPTPMVLRTPIVYESDVQATPRNLPDQEKSTSGFQRDTERIALSRYAPPSVTVNSNMEILQFQGRTAPCLEPVSGVPSNNLFKMARQELVHGLHATIQSAIKKNASARFEGVSFEVDGKRRTINIEVIPTNILAPPKQRNFVIFFEEVSSTSSPKQAKPATNGKKGREKVIQDKLSQRVIQLEEDLAACKLSQKSLAEEFETSQEELTSANEELQSANEELQSTNEELETSKEELQSSNEELTTVNDELQIRNADLVVLSNDLSNILNNVEVPIVIVGGDRRIRKFTSKAETVFNLIPSDVGRPLSDIKPNFECDLQAMVSKVKETLSPQENEVHVHKSRWMRLQVRPYRTVDDRIDGVVVTLIDITAIKEHLTESQLALKYATSIADTLQLPLVVLDENLHLLSANQGFAKKFTLVPHKDIGSDLMSVLGGAGWHIPHLRRLLSDVIAEDRELIEYEIEHDFPELGHRIMLLNARQIRWQDSMPKALLLSIDDITERRVLERETERAKADAEQANATKDIFLATLSHELRTPLASILSWAQLIQKEKVGPDKLKYAIQIIEQSARIQGQLIDDLLDIARIQAGKLSIEFTDVDPGEPVRLAIEAVRLMAEKKHIVVESEIKLTSETVWGDPERLQQIVWNLLTNAIKFSSDNAKILVRVEPFSHESQNFISIKVIDHGKGIKSDFLPNLFERFRQADSSSVRMHGGLGLGLALVRDLARLHSGFVRAESDGMGKGSTFTVLLPVKSAISERTGEEGILSLEEAEEESDRPDLNGLRVMIVEDEASTLDVLSETLKSFGAQTAPCSSAAEALISFEKFRPDVLVSDIAMPGEDGYSLIKKIREIGPERNGDVPSLALTAYATEGDVKRTLSAGFDSHIAKPFDNFRLGHAIARLAKPAAR